ncbi:MAG: HEPN domain-containing protein [Acidimicrobiia bacterium]
MTPGESAYSQEQLAVAERALLEAATLLKSELVEGAVSRLYYAVFHAARAALASRGRTTRTHSGQIKTFNEVFGPAPILGELLKLRSDADYGEGIDKSVEDLRTPAAEAAAFLARCRELVAEGIGAGPDEPDPPPDL